MTLDNRELATVLAALRLWQTDRPQQPKADITGWPLVSERQGMLLDIADNGGTVEPLNIDEIDELCERLNTQSDDGNPFHPESPEGRQWERLRAECHDYDLDGNPLEREMGTGDDLTEEERDAVLADDPNWIADPSIGGALKVDPAA